MSQYHKDYAVRLQLAVQFNALASPSHSSEADKSLILPIEGRNFHKMKG